MKNVFASVLVLGVIGSAVGCAGGMPGMGECKFNKGEVTASITGDAKAFLDAAMELKTTSDKLEAEWSAEIKAMAGELSVTTADETGVLAKLNANVQELKAKGQCEVVFDANLDVGASASGSAEAKGEGKGAADSSKGAKGDAKGDAKADAKADAHANVDVKFDFKCKAEASVKATLDVTTATVKAHFPKLLGIVVSYKALLPKVKAVAESGSSVMANVKSNLAALPEVKCAVEAVTGIKAEARVDFSVKASASAKGEAKAG